MPKSGQVQILINNAGTNLRRDITDFTLAEWRGVQDTNLTSAFLMCRAFVPHMKGTGYGRIINMTSIMAHVSIPQRSLYSSTKAALLGITKALALELAPEGSQSTASAPAHRHGNERAYSAESRVERAVHFKDPVGRWGKVEEVGAARGISLRRRRGLHHRDGHPDRRGLVCGVRLRF